MQEFFEGLARRAAFAGSAPALVSPRATISYSALIERVRGHAQWATRLPKRVGLLFGKGPDYVMCDLALSFAGKDLVPLPEFFSDSQLKHIIETTQLTDVVADQSALDRAQKLVPSAHLLTSESASDLAPATETRRVIFTSGTTGKPKGVCLSARQFRASMTALAQAIRAAASDRYLSLLPNALLLEQIAGIYLPLSVGASIHVYPEALAATRGSHIAKAVELAGATTTVLVPELLSAWVNELRTHDLSAPPSLRFVAVGGAPVLPQLAAAAWRHGLPVYEGYGLSECCSVVAVNRPQTRRAGTVGRQLPTVEVEIDNDEIVVNGPTVMDGYVDEPKWSGPWRTGDLGYLDADGFLVVTGRKDDVIVTTEGRNVSPEWIEQAITADHRIGRCIVVASNGDLIALLVPRHAALCADAAALSALVATAVRDLPHYARPRFHLALSEQELSKLDLVTANGRPRRRDVTALVAERRRSQQLQCA